MIPWYVYLAAVIAIYAFGLGAVLAILDERGVGEEAFMMAIFWPLTIWGLLGFAAVTWVRQCRGKRAGVPAARVVEPEDDAW